MILKKKKILLRPLRMQDFFLTWSLSEDVNFILIRITETSATPATQKKDSETTYFSVSEQKTNWLQTYRVLTPPPRRLRTCPQL